MYIQLYWRFLHVLLWDYLPTIRINSTETLIHKSGVRKNAANYGLARFNSVEGHGEYAVCNAQVTN